jgi:hypothetical protein
MIKHGVVNARDAGQEAVRSVKMAAVHSDVAHAGFGVSCNKRPGHADGAAEARLLDRRGQHGQAELFQFGAGVDFLLDFAALDHDRSDRVRHRVAPLFVDFLRIVAAHSESDDAARRAVHAGQDLHVVAAAFGVGDILEQKRLARFVGPPAILQAHERHQLAVFVDRTRPAVELASLIEVIQKVA